MPSAAVGSSPGVSSESMPPSLAELTARLDIGPAGLDDARAAVAAAGNNQSDELDLQQMRLTDADFEALLPELASLASHVTSLNLFLNDLTFLPPGLGDVLPRLRSLMVGANPLLTVHDDALDGLAELEELDVGFSDELIALPTSLRDCKSLRILYAGNGRVSTLPEELFECSKLEELHIYGNSLSEIPPAIGKLSKLRVLSMGRNQVKRLPQELAECAALECLYVYENELSSLPRGMGALESLRVLNVDNNVDLPRLPPEVRGGSPQEIADFYSKPKET